MSQQEYIEINLGRIRAEHMPRLVQGVCIHYGYTDTLEDGSPNPETRVQYARRKLREEIRNIVRRAERKQAIDQINVDTIEVTE